ncbi:2-dehydro-3-deoxygalactonokinase [Sphingobium scionense]|uniref:2-dehydro-3-deoxygalactonokinase n=1 Tax=Sphingobium scionense TaxID=1404341 RepID=A0A7W6LPM3_9SPHN|nr:2-dehydro-3-deoxygalactonokinase [Sphingobium scionense]MBB4147067.1 2-dehydro-3-deoxygalactonokinase [Sphingobium scionense]
MNMLIAGDWGSSNMRLHLCRVEEGRLVPVETVRGKGAKDVADHEAAFRAAAGDWIDRHGPMPVLLSGMIGSTIGWREAAYLPCPAGPEAMAGALLRFEAAGCPVAIVPGLSCRNIFGQPDVMRGEEVQLFGWLAGVADDDADRLICLPGTHAKWVRTRGRTVLDFVTSMQGEMRELLLAHGLLGRSLAKPYDPAAPTDIAAFDVGAGLVVDDPTLAIEHGLFALRSRILMGELTSEAAPSFLSGLMIGAEVRDAVAAHRARGMAVETIVLVGAELLVDLYGRVCDRLGIATEKAAGDGTALAGLSAIAARMEAAAA